MEDIVRNFLGLIFLSGAGIIVVTIFVALIIAHYLASKSAFDFSGYEGLPLASEAFIGQIVGPFFPEATLSHFYAFVVAMVIALALFVLTNRLFHIWDLMKDRKAYLAQNDSESAQIILNKMHETMLLIAIIIPCLAGAINWDFQLFLYRSMVGALGIEDPSQAPLTVLNWEHQLKENGHYFAWQLARIGAWGYIGVTGAASVITDFCIRRIVERFLMLLYSIKSIILPDPGGPDDDGGPNYAQASLALDTARNPITTKTSPEVEPANDKVTAATSREHHQQEEIRTQKAPPNTDRPTNIESPQAQDTARPKDTERAETGTSNAGLATPVCSNDSQASLFDDEETFQSLGSRRSESAQLKEVIGKPGGSVSLATAMADKEHYWVDPDSLEIWDLNYRKSLFPETF